MIVKVKELYDLLDDCHSALAKATINDNLYDRISKRLIDMKKSLHKNSIAGSNICPSCGNNDNEYILVYSKSCNKCSNEWIDKEGKKAN